jgi:hypothetical protein
LQAAVVVGASYAFGRHLDRPGRLSHPAPARGDRGGDTVVRALRPPYRDVEELLAERGIEVDHVTIYRWVQRFMPLLADAARFTRHSPGDRRFVDET